MNFRKISIALGAAVLPCLALAVPPTDTATLSVSADVPAICRLYSALPISFASLAITGSGNITAGGTVVYRCTNGTAPRYFSFSTESGTIATRRLTASDGSYMLYDLSLASLDTGTGFASTEDKFAYFTASIAPGQYQNAKAGSYTDDIVLTIVY